MNYLHQPRNHLSLLFVLCLILLLPVSVWSQTSDHDELLRIHRTMLETKILHHDGALVETVALDQLLLIPPGGILESKEEALAGIRVFAIEQVVIEDEVITQQGTTADALFASRYPRWALLTDSRIEGRCKSQNNFVARTSWEE